MKKYFSLLCIILVVALALVGCGNDSSTTPTEQTPAQTETNDPAKTDEFVSQIMFNGSSTLAPVIASISIKNNGRCRR